MNVFAEFDEIPSMILQDVKETKRYGRTFVRSDGQRENSIPSQKHRGGGGGGYNNVYDMKAGSFIDESAEFQTNRLMDIKYAHHLVRLVPGRRGPL